MAAKKSTGNAKAKAERVDAIRARQRQRAASRNKAMTPIPGNVQIARTVQQITRLLSQLPGSSEAANRNMRISGQRAYQVTKAEHAKKAGGGTARSGMALTRARNRWMKPTPAKGAIRGKLKTTNPKKYG